MAGNISFGDEEEARQTEALAGRIIEDTVSQHSVVGERVTAVKWTAPSWDKDVMVVDDLNITFSSGLRISCPTAHIDPSSVSGGFGAALRAENARQAETAPKGGGIRAAGERLADHSGPDLDAAGDPVGEEFHNPVEFPSKPPEIHGTEITREA